MKGAMEVPSTVTVIIMQYTLIRRMKWELAFPISPTYSLKYSSRGLSTEVLVFLLWLQHCFYRSGRMEGCKEKSWNILRTSQVSPTKACSGFPGRGTLELTLTLSLSPVSFLAQGFLSQLQGLFQGCSATQPPLHPEQCSSKAIGFHNCTGVRKCKHLE